MRYAIFILWFFFPIYVWAQPPGNYSFHHIDQQDGLLHANVNAVVQDSKGFIWILSSNGLQRYDGSRFVNYPFDLSNPNYISNTNRLNLFYDKAINCLWLMNWQIEQLDLNTNKFTLYDADHILKNRHFTFNPYSNSKGETIYAGHFGLLATNKKQQTIEPLLLTAPFLKPNTSNLFFQDERNQNIYMTTWDGITLFSNSDKKVYTHEYNPVQDSLLMLMDKKKLSAIMKDSRQNIWISTGTPAFYKYNTLSKKLSSYSLNIITGIGNKKSIGDPLQIVKFFFEDHQHHIWIGTANAGLLAYSETNDSFSVINNDENNKQGLHFNYEIACMFQDSEENIWIGTDKGINIFNPYQPYSRSIHHEAQNALSLPKNEITSFIQATNGDILAGTWGGGITVFDSSWHFKHTLVFSAPYEYNLIWSFIQNDDGTIWAGCQHGYIHIYDPATEKILKTICPPALDHYTIWCMAKQSNGNILLGLHNGKIAVWNKKEQKFYAYNDSLKGIAQAFTPVTNIFIDRKQRCWASTDYGLKLFDPARGNFSAVYIADKNKSDAISGNKVEGVEQLDDATLMIGTAYGGMNFFNINSGKFSHFTTKNGLPANTIHAIKKDTAGNVWFTTDYDLYKFKTGGSHFIHYNLEAGMLNAEFRSPLFCPLQNGSWLTGTVYDIINFWPQNELHKSKKTKIEITALKILDTDASVDSLVDINSEVRLSYEQNFLTIEFSGFQFLNPGQVNYYYRLDNVDKNWINAGRKNFASYTDLKPGAYSFYVKDENSTGIADLTVLKFVITPPFWKTWWFVLLAAALAGMLIYLFIKWRLHTVRTVEAEKLKVQQLNAAQYKNKLEMEQIVNYFSSSLIDKNTVDDVLWDVAKNLLGRLGFVDCMMYLWNEDKTKMIQRAGYGPKGSVEEIRDHYFDAEAGQGVVGYVMQSREPVIIADTSKDTRYRVDEMARLSEITVPVIYNDELIGVIDSEHHERNFFTQQHLQVMNTIATLMANKIHSIQSEQSFQQAKMEVLGINEKLMEARLEALRSQMNPHFIFNCLNSIDNLIQNNENDKATDYLAKFAKLIRYVLETSGNNTVPCWKDMETLELYLELEALRFDNQFSYEISISDDIMQGDYKVPPLVIQPFVENAVHHGLLNKIESDKKLLVAVWVSNHQIKYTIEDNGVGRSVAAGYNKLNKIPHRSMGMQITIERINLFNHHTEDMVAIIDLYDKYGNPAGTKVQVSLIQQ